MCLHLNPPLVLFSINVSDSLASHVFPLNIDLLCYLMSALSRRHCSCSSHSFTKFLSNLLSTASDLNLCSMASFFMSSIASSRSFVDVLRKEISRSNFFLEEY